MLSLKKKNYWEKNRMGGFKKKDREREREIFKSGEGAFLLLPGSRPHPPTSPKSASLLFGEREMQETCAKRRLQLRGRKAQI